MLLGFWGSEQGEDWNTSEKEAYRCGIAFVWIGSSLQMLFSVLRVADMLYGRIGQEMITPALMMSPVGNFIAAMAFAGYAPKYSSESADADDDKVNDVVGDANYIRIARLWFAVGAVMGISLFSMAFYKAILDHHSDRRLRPTLWIWMAASSVAGPAYLAVSGSNYAGDAAIIADGVLYQSLFMFSLFLCAVNGVGVLRGFYSYVPDMSIWIMAFSYTALALNAYQYYTFIDDGFTRVIAIIAVTIACSSCAVCFGYTLGWALDFSLFKARNKWGPVSFMKLTHEVFRFAMPKLISQLNGLSESSNPIAVARFVKDFQAFMVTYSEHGNHEDLVLFPTLRRFHPGLNPSMDEEHEYEHSIVLNMQQVIQKYKDSNGSSESIGPMLQLLKEEFPSWAQHLLDHCRNEGAYVLNHVNYMIILLVM
jgi:tellurite resistance protein TehA-like permease/hemerythrin superfamily protein